MQAGPFALQSQSHVHRMYANLPDLGLVSGYDTNAPPWGQTAQQVLCSALLL
jgi:hypothetical protein